MPTPARTDVCTTAHRFPVTPAAAGPFGSLCVQEGRAGARPSLCAASSLLHEDDEPSAAISRFSQRCGVTVSGSGFSRPRCDGAPSSSGTPSAGFGADRRRGERGSEREGEEPIGQRRTDRNLSARYTAHFVVRASPLRSLVAAGRPIVSCRLSSGA
jgi:hypothetical protein